MNRRNVLALLALGGIVSLAEGRSPQPAPVAGSAAPTSLERANAVTVSIQKDLYNERTGLYFQSTEKHEPEFMWGNGVMFPVLVAAARHDPATYTPLMERFFSAMDRYWDAKSAIHGYEPSPTRGGGNDKYYDDNQWMVIAFVEAHELTGDAKYLNRAVETLKFSLSGWDDKLGGGIWWHEGYKDETKNTCSNAPAAVACLKVARFRDRAENIEWARKLVAWTNAKLQDADGLFFDRVKVEDGRIIKGKLTYNSGLMIRANLGLYRETKEDAFLTEAVRIAKASDFFVKKETGGYRDGAKFSHLLLEADLELYRATKDEAILARAKSHGEALWKRWQAAPPKEMLERAAIARTFWLLADMETEVGRKFWEETEKRPSESAP